MTSASTSLAQPFTFGSSLPQATFNHIRRQLLLDHCKWDPQVGDVSTLAPFPLILSSETWNFLQYSARALSSELLAAETEIFQRPDLLKHLGLPRSIRKLFEASRHALSPGAFRLMRFDFHYTTEGWRISEVNNDVPGGFTEATRFPELYQPHYPSTQLCGNPVKVLIHRLSELVTTGKLLLFAAPEFMEDQQIISFLGRALRKAGVEAASPPRNSLAGTEQSYASKTRRSQ